MLYGYMIVAGTLRPISIDPGSNEPGMTLQRALQLLAVSGVNAIEIKGSQTPGSGRTIRVNPSNANSRNRPKAAPRKHEKKRAARD
jgi:hypothetical protein